MGAWGIRDIYTMNEALLLKLAWNFLNNPNKFWVKILHSKYLSNSNFWDATSKASNSDVWKNILRVRKYLTDGCIWKIKDGKNINVWDRAWIFDRNGPPTAKPNQEFHPVKVNELLSDGNWNADLLATCFDDNSVARILRTPVFPDQREDSLIWGFTPNGTSNIKSAYTFLFDRTKPPSTSNQSICKKLWFSKVAKILPPKIITFV